MKRIDRIRQATEQQRQWIEDHGGDREGYIRRYGDPGRAPLDENGNSKTVSVPAELAEAAGLRPVPNAVGCYFKEHYGAGGTAIYIADIAKLERLTTELAYLTARNNG
jgi:hypothetical protein